MRKTPLSAPGGSYGRKNNYDWNFRDQRQPQQPQPQQQPQQQHSFDDRSGYGNFQSDNNKHAGFSSVYNQPSPQKISDDFIPLGNSSPVNHRPRYNNFGNWRGHGNVHRHRGTPPNRGGRGFNNSYRHNHYHDTPKSSFDESNSPRFYQKHHHFGNRRPHQRDAHRHVDISNYVNVKSMLEDPWAELMKNLERKRTETSKEKIDTPNRMASGSSCGSILIEELTVKPNSPNLNMSDQEARITVNEKSEATSTVTTTMTTTTS